MLRKILFAVLFLVSMKSAANEIRSKAVDWDANCRQFARKSYSTQNCESIYRELYGSLSEDDRANIEKIFPRSHFCPTTNKTRSNACRYHQIEMATLIKSHGDMKCYMILGLVLSCEIDDQLYKFGTVSHVDVLRVGEEYGVQNLYERPRPSAKSVQ